MKLYLQRGFFTKESTGGLLIVDETIECFTLEDQVRVQGKVMHETAIPFGIYEVVLSHSPKYGVLMPEIKNVPGFTGIRIHPGNTDEDTSGCLLVGQNMTIENNDIKITNSKIAFDLLMAKLRKATEAKESITIEITEH